MSTVHITLQQQDAADACWSFLRDKKASLANRGFDCGVSCLPDRLTGGQRICLSWVPGIGPVHSSVSLRASRNYVLELTVCSNDEVLCSYSGCGIDTRETRRAITTGPALASDLESFFVEFEVTSRFTHHQWFVMPPMSQESASRRNR